ncbi:hypothetical protein [Nostoc sp.]|uniref:hypothetical protein n=1 Tax=Nostoc sp. TaxID=1180 RepID=UPI002FFAD925
MKFAVSIIKPSDYPHSAAFQEVAESIHYGLTELDYDSILLQLDLQLCKSDRKQIISKLFSHLTLVTNFSDD